VDFDVKDENYKLMEKHLELKLTRRFKPTKGFIFGFNMTLTLEQPWMRFVSIKE
jgi:hypothetical protein